MTATTPLTPETCLYAVLGVAKSAGADAIKKAYRKLALKYHPDRHSGADEAALDELKAKFQQISFVYSILSDEARKLRYDKTGNFDDLAPGLDVDFRDLYESMVTPEAIEEFKKEYQGSDEERTDLLEAYVQHEGDMGLILETVPCSSVDDEDRFSEILQAAIKAKQVPAFAAFTEESPKAKLKRKREAEEEAAEAEKLAAELGMGKKQDQDDDEALKQLILQNQKRRQGKFDSMMDQLEAKYAPKPKKSKLAKEDDKPATKPAEEPGSDLDALDELDEVDEESAAESSDWDSESQEDNSDDDFSEDLEEDDDDDEEDPRPSRRTSRAAAQPARVTRSAAKKRG